MKNMKSLIEKFEALSEEKWSAEVDTKWSPPEGFFKQSADEIVKDLMSASEDLAQAMQRLNFYINRAGDNLSSEDKAKLEDAKKKLSAMGKEEPMGEAISGVEDGQWNPKYKYSSKEISAMTANAQMSLEKALQMLKKAYANGRPEEIMAAVARAIGGVDPLVTVFAGSDVGGKLMTLGHKLSTISKKKQMESDNSTIGQKVSDMIESEEIRLDPKTGLIILD